MLSEVGTVVGSIPTYAINLFQMSGGCKIQDRRCFAVGFNGEKRSSVPDTGSEMGGSIPSRQNRNNAIWCSLLDGAELADVPSMLRFRKKSRTGRMFLVFTRKGSYQFWRSSSTMCRRSKRCSHFKTALEWSGLLIVFCQSRLIALSRIINVRVCRVNSTSHG